MFHLVALNWEDNSESLAEVNDPSALDHSAWHLWSMSRLIKAKQLVSLWKFFAVYVRYLLISCNTVRRRRCGMRGCILSNGIGTLTSSVSVDFGYSFVFRWPELWLWRCMTCARDINAAVVPLDSSFVPIGEVVYWLYSQKMGDQSRQARGHSEDWPLEILSSAFWIDGKSDRQMRRLHMANAMWIHRTKVEIERKTG